MKKIKSLLMALVLSMISATQVFAYSVEDVYEEFKETYPEFISEINSQNITDELMVEFLFDVQSYMKELNAAEKITEENFEKNAMSAISAVSARSNYLVLQDALIILYPNAIKQAILYGEIAPEFVPIVNTVKALIFAHDMLEEEESSATGSGESEKVITAIKNLSETIFMTDEYKLPQQLIAVTETGTEVNVTVKWTGSINASKEGTYSVHGIISLPEGYEFDDNMTNGVDYTVIVISEEDSRFSDIDSSHWAYESVSYLADNMILNGYLDGAFRPENQITRAEFAKIVVSAMNKFDYEAKASFSDVNENEWYYPYVASAMKEGYILGYPDESFKPEANITRADICTIVYRCLTSEDNKQTESNETEDIQEITDDEVTENVQAENDESSGNEQAEVAENIESTENIKATEDEEIPENEEPESAETEENQAENDEVAENEVVVSFNDDSMIPPYAKDAVYALAENGVINGMGENTFCPLEFATRAQTAKIVYNAFFRGDDGSEE